MFFTHTPQKNITEKVASNFVLLGLLGPDPSKMSKAQCRLSARLVAHVKFVRGHC